MNNSIDYTYPFLSLFLPFVYPYLFITNKMCTLQNNCLLFTSQDDQLKRHLPVEISTLQILRCWNQLLDAIENDSV